ncbi:hypothetical protein LPB86_13070 [Pedobacter sp. MC2016-14]|uniref:hypothetical protein n=1 Tax=Pedobacter sp. MC2016-14 TaxID=2897327 RepID=UPI001E62522D|nr:hypothetical protein [Pedobacter sp. MC2016-14]MCD0489165.1 hypothetical protein [Pedobacter sp. MC2016-14]
MKILVASCMIAASALSLKAQEKSIIVEAESGKAGSQWETKSELGMDFITVKSDGLSPDHPDNEDRVVTYKVTFPKPGIYNLYARIRVGASGPKDDSFYTSESFGEISYENQSSWTTFNGLFNKGYKSSDAAAVVDEAGAAGTKEWKWIKLTGFSSMEKGLPYKVKENALTQIFKLGAREDGIDIDKFVFSPSKQDMTVQALNAAE